MPPRNPYTSATSIDMTAPAYQMFKVTASDTLPLPNGPCRGLLVGTAGAADLYDGSNTLCAAVPLQAGYNWIGVMQIKATSLLASNIWALY